MKTLAKDISSISFYEREKKGGSYVRNKCGRDFIYYCLNYYFPERFNIGVCNPAKIDSERLFGYPTPAYLAWSQIQFKKLPYFLDKLDLQLEINGENISSFRSFLKTILFSKKTYDGALQEIEKCVDTGIPCGIDISIGLGGLLDHVIFVYGYDAENLYVIDTHNVLELNYQETKENKLLFKLSKKMIYKRWTRFGRVWKIFKKGKKFPL